MNVGDLRAMPTVHGEFRIERWDGRAWALLEESATEARCKELIPRLRRRPVK